MSYFLYLIQDLLVALLGNNSLRGISTAAGSTEQFFKGIL